MINHITLYAIEKRKILIQKNVLLECYQRYLEVCFRNNVRLNFSSSIIGIYRHPGKRVATLASLALGVMIAGVAAPV